MPHNTTLSKPKTLQRLITILALLAGVYSLLSFAYYWDTTRIMVKRLTASSPYLYEEINPKFLKQNPAKLISIGSPEEAKAARNRLIKAVFGLDSLPLKTLPDEIQDISKSPICAGYDFSGLAELARFECVRIRLDGVYKATFGFFHPRKKTNRAMIFHYGYAGTYDSQEAHFKTLLENGFAVIAHNLIGFGDSAPLKTWDQAQHPLRAFFEPVVVSINYAMKNGYETINMMGLSAGGWMTAVAAAMDERIKASYPVAGVLPLYLRRKKETASPQYYAPMLKAASYLDMFVLGSWGKGRRQIQIFNRYDRCCFANTRGKLYEAQVARTVNGLGSGKFSVMIDETHARHKISDHGMRAILEDAFQ